MSSPQYVRDIPLDILIAELKRRKDAQECQAIRELQGRQQVFMSCIDTLLLLVPEHDKKCQACDGLLAESYEWRNDNQRYLKCDRCYLLYAKNSGWVDDVDLSLSIFFYRPAIK